MADTIPGLEKISNEISQENRIRRQEQVNRNIEPEKEFDKAQFESQIKVQVSGIMNAMLDSLRQAGINISDDLEADLVNSACQVLSTSLLTNIDMLTRFFSGDYSIPTNQIQFACLEAPQNTERFIKEVGLTSIDGKLSPDIFKNQEKLKNQNQPEQNQSETQSEIEESKTRNNFEIDSEFKAKIDITREAYISTLNENLQEALKYLDDEEIETSPKVLTMIYGSEEMMTEDERKEAESSMTTDTINTKDALYYVDKKTAELEQQCTDEKEKGKIKESADKFKNYITYIKLIGAGKIDKAQEFYEKLEDKDKKIINGFKDLGLKDPLGAFRDITIAWSKGEFSEDDKKLFEKKYHVKIDDISELFGFDITDIKNINNTKIVSAVIINDVLKQSKLKKIDEIFSRGIIDENARNDYAKKIEEFTMALADPNTPYSAGYLKGFFDSLDKMSEDIEKRNEIDIKLSLGNLKNLDITSFEYAQKYMDKNHNEVEAYNKIFGRYERRYEQKAKELFSSSEKDGPHKANILNTTARNLSLYRFSNIEYINELLATKRIDQDEFKRRKEIILKNCKIISEQLDAFDINSDAKDLREISLLLIREKKALEEDRRENDSEEYLKDYTDRIKLRINKLPNNMDVRKALFELLSDKDKMNYEDFSYDSLKKIFDKEINPDKNNEIESLLVTILNPRDESYLKKIFKDDKLREIFLGTIKESIDEKTKDNQALEENSSAINRSMSKMFVKLDRTGISKESQEKAVEEYIQLINIALRDVKDVHDSKEIFEFMKAMEETRERKNEIYKSGSLNEIYGEEANGIKEALDIMLSYNFEGNLDILCANKSEFIKILKENLNSRSSEERTDKSMIHITKASSTLFSKELASFAEKLQNGKSLTDEERKYLQNKLSCFNTGLRDGVVRNLTDNDATLLKDELKKLEQKLKGNEEISSDDFIGLKNDFDKYTDSIDKIITFRNNYYAVKDIHIYEKIQELRERGFEEREIYSKLFLNEKKSVHLLSGLRAANLRQQRLNKNKGIEGEQVDPEKIICAIELEGILKFKYGEYLSKTGLKAGSKEYELQLARMMRKIDDPIQDLANDGWNDFSTKYPKIISNLTEYRGKIEQERIDNNIFDIQEFTVKNNDDVSNRSLDRTQNFYKILGKAIGEFSKEEISRLKKEVLAENDFSDLTKEEKKERISSLVAKKIDEKLAEQFKDTEYEKLFEKYADDGYMGFGNADILGRLIQNPNYREKLLEDIHNQEKNAEDKKAYFKRIEPYTSQMLIKMHESVATATHAEKANGIEMFVKDIEKFKSTHPENKYETVEEFKEYLKNTEKVWGDNISENDKKVYEALRSTCDPQLVYEYLECDVIKFYQMMHKELFKGDLIHTVGRKIEGEPETYMQTKVSKVSKDLQVIGDKSKQENLFKRIIKVAKGKVTNAIIDNRKKKLNESQRKKETNEERPISDTEMESLLSVNFEESKPRKAKKIEIKTFNISEKFSSIYPGKKKQDEMQVKTSSTLQAEEIITDDKKDFKFTQPSFDLSQLGFNEIDEGMWNEENKGIPINRKGLVQKFCFGLKEVMAKSAKRVRYSDVFRSRETLERLMQYSSKGTEIGNTENKYIQSDSINSGEEK